MVVYIINNQFFVGVGFYFCVIQTILFYFSAIDIYIMSNNAPVPIDPPVVVPQPDLTFDNMTVQVMSINLGISATFNVFLYNGNLMVATRVYTMTGEDYNNWGNDDQYVYTWIIEQLRAPQN
jgi:hypothetical protein